MKQDRREAELAAVIDLGSRAVRMDILEFAAGKTPVLLETLRREVDLGREVCRTGEVPPGEISLVCEIMADCRRKLDEYRSIPVRARAAGALRAAANAELVADRIFQTSGILPELPEPAVESYRFAAAVRRSLEASGIGAENTMIAAFSDAWSVLLLGFDAGVLCFGEELPVGGDRLPEDMAETELADAVAAAVAASGALRRLNASLTGAPTLLVLTGDGARRIAGVDEDSAAARQLTAAEFKKRAQKSSGAAEAAGVAAAVLKEFSCCGVAVPTFTPRSILREPPVEDGATFAADLANVAAAFGRRFAVDSDFAERTAYAAAELYRKLCARCNFSGRFSPLLEAAAHLCDVGGGLAGAKAGDASARVVASLFLPGVSDAERRLVAEAVRFAKSGRTLPEDVSDLPPALRPALFRMAAILRCASALALAPGGVAGMRLNFAGDELVITLRGVAAGAERSELARSAALFLRVFGLTPRLGEASL